MRKTDITGTIVLRFTADWCGPCKSFAPEFKKVAAEFPEIQTLDCDVDKGFGDLAYDLGVRGIPCVVFIKDGEEVSRLNGKQPAAVVKTEFEKLK